MSQDINFIVPEEGTEQLYTDFVFMEKTVSVLDIGFSNNKNVILFGPGGHGKSELTLEFFKAKGIEPFIFTMGTGTTTDRLFGGIDIPQFETTGKLEYLVDNSFMNHEYVIFEEMMDAPDFILEQLKDILSSGFFRNGNQIFKIKTKFIVCCTNRTREEFAKNNSLKALMERFPLELNVVWETYNSTTYDILLKRKFQVEDVDPIIPYILEQYAKAGHIISPRIAITAYEIYAKHGPESLMFVADFSKNSELIKKSITEFEQVKKFFVETENLKELAGKLKEQHEAGSVNKKDYEAFEKVVNAYSKLKVSDQYVSAHQKAKEAGEGLLKALGKSFKVKDVVGMSEMSE